MGSQPFPYRRFHILPRTGDPQDGFRQDLYISRDLLPGFTKVGEGLYGLKRNPLDPVDPRVVISSIPGRTEEITFGLGTGGVIQQWRVVDELALLDVEWLNHADWAGRSMQSVLFWTSRAIPGEVRRAANPTWAGSWHSEFPGMDQDILPGYEALDFLQGGQNTVFIVQGSGGPSPRIFSQGCGLEWDPDGTFADPTQVTSDGWGGTVVDPLQSFRTPFSFDVRCNVGGRAGLHRIDSEIALPDGFAVDSEDTFSSVPFTLHPRFMFDQAWAYRSDTDAYTELHKPSLPSLNRPILIWERPSSANLRGQLEVPHGRRGSCMGRVLDAGNLGAQWRKIIFDQGATRFRIDPVGSVLPIGGRLVMPEFRLMDFDNAQGRFCTADHLHVGSRPPQASHDQSGGYWDISPFCEGPNAFIYRALPSAPHPWSLGKDFCVGMYWPRLSHRLPQGQSGLDQIYWRAARGSGLPTNGVRAPSTMVLHWSRDWGPGAAFSDVGSLSESMFLLLGTFDQVTAHVAYLRNETDFGQ